MKRLTMTAIACLSVIAAALVCFTASRSMGAIELTAPETIPAKVANRAQIMEIRLRFYTDGKNMMFAVSEQQKVDAEGKPVVDSEGKPVMETVAKGTAAGYVEWRTGTGDGAEFQTITAGKYIELTAEDLYAVLLAAQQVTPTEYLFGDKAKETPMDKILPALIGILKQKGKM